MQDNHFIGDYNNYLNKRYILFSIFYLNFYLYFKIIKKY